ncbi:MAG: bifunctional riboflavin kinase/FAD synthetase, partial [Candidatus Omnitrophica bacterium]|nr:bifunctional riboflavin kinase/FAD synthetase [Candidatus Omnitrophota bacterium]
MKTIWGLKSLKRPAKSSVVTIGVFDGIHKGHEAVIKKTVERSKELGLKSMVVTFDPHPLKVVHPSPYVPSLISLGHRIKLIEKLGVDITVIVRFTRSIARLSAETFVRDLLTRRLGSREIYVGENFYFGKGAGASARTLKRMARLFGIKVRTVAPVIVDRRVVSSSVIRGLVTIGALGKAARFLGRPVSILGTVVRGSRIGRILGYPTANINPHHEAIPES